MQRSEFITLIGGAVAVFISNFRLPVRHSES
jgi:hypothetical protein